MKVRKRHTKESHTRGDAIAVMAFLLQSVMEWTGIASIPDFPFTLCPHARRISCDFLYGCSSTLLWTLQDGVTRNVNNSSSSLFVLPVGSTVSIFHLSLSTLSEDEKRLARNALRRARTIRIRGLLQCFGGTEYKDHIYIATEHCVPLAHYLLADVTHPSLVSPAFSSSSLHGPQTERSASNLSSVSSNAKTTKRKDESWMSDTNEKTLFIQRELDAVCWEEESDHEKENENDNEGEEEMGEESSEDAVSVHDDHQNSTKDTSQVTDDIQSVEENLGGTTTAGGCCVPMQQRPDWLLFAYSGVSPKTLALGLKTITKGIHALHANQLHHGNIHPSCVFVAVRTGFWLLFGFEFLSEIGETQTARQAAIPPPSSSFSFPWGSGSPGNGGGAAGQEFGMENGLSFMSGGHVFFPRLKEREGQWKGKQRGPERSSSAGNLSTRGRNHPLEGLVPPEFSLPPKAEDGGGGEGGSSSSSHSVGLERDDTLLSTSMSSVSKLWNTWVHAGPVSTKSAEEMRMHEHCTPILSSILEAPWKAAAWDAWGLSRLFYFSYVALQYQMHALVGDGPDSAAAQAATSNAPVSGTPTNDVHDGAGRERWEQFSRSLCKVAEQLGADDPKERLQGVSSFADLLRDEENDADDGRRGSKSSKSVGGICWSQEEYVKCMEMTELYPVLEADEKDQLVWRVIRELYTSLHTYITPSSSSSFIASSSSTESSSGPMTHGDRLGWSLTPFSGMLWMIERIMANLFSYIPRRLVVGILLLGQHLLLPPRTRMGSDDGGNKVTASYASVKKEKKSAHDALLPLDASSSSPPFVASPSAFSTVGAFWYDGTIGPLLAYMFRLREPFIRFQLLESTPLFAPYLSTSRWNDEIWPLLAECFHHASQSSLEILIATTKTAIFAAPFLSSSVLAEQVIPSIRKHLIANPDPSLRVNGLLCVSQILPNVGHDRCGPLAAEVYGKGVQDTHDAVRFVSVKGIQKCLQWMSPLQVVKYALPLVIPLAVDRYTPSREGSWAVLQESLHLFRATYGASEATVGDAMASALPSQATSVTPASARSADGRTSASSFSRASTPPVHGRPCSTAPSSSCPSLVANPGSRYGERHSQVGGGVVPSLAGSAAVELEEWHFHLPRDHLDALRLLKELDHDLHSPLLSAPPAPSRRRSLVSFSPPPTATAAETHKAEPSRREEWKGTTAPAPLTRIPSKKEAEEEEEWQAGQWSEATPTPSVPHRVTTSSEGSSGHHDRKGMLHAVPAKGEVSPVKQTNPGVTPVVTSPTQAIPLAMAARRYSAMFLPPPTTTTSLPSRLPGATAKSLDLEGFSLGHSASPLVSAGGGRGGGGGSGESTTKSIPHRNTISSLRFTAAPKQPQDGKVGESGNEAGLHSSLHSTGILSESSETEGVRGSRAEWGSRRGSAFGDSAMNSLAGSSTNPLASSNSDGRGIKSIGSKRVGKGLGGRKCD